MRCHRQPPVHHLRRLRVLLRDQLRRGRRAGDRLPGRANLTRLRVLPRAVRAVHGARLPGRKPRHDRHHGAAAVSRCWSATASTRSGSACILVMYIELGQISPPIGINLFVIQSIWNGKLSEVVMRHDPVPPHHVPAARVADGVPAARHVAADTHEFLNRRRKCDASQGQDRGHHRRRAEPGRGHRQRPRHRPALRPGGRPRSWRWTAIAVSPRKPRSSRAPKGGDCVAFEADVTREATLPRRWTRRERFGRLDILHYNVGVSLAGGDAPLDRDHRGGLRPRLRDQPARLRSWRASTRCRSCGRSDRA